MAHRKLKRPRKDQGQHGRAFVSIVPDVHVVLQDDDWEPLIGEVLVIPGGTELDLVEGASDADHALLRVRDTYLPPCRVAVPHAVLAVQFTAAAPGSGPRASVPLKMCAHTADQVGRTRCPACFWRWWRDRALAAGREDLVPTAVKRSPRELPPRLRTAASIDLSKAKASCPRCHGTGRLGFRTIDDPEQPGLPRQVPVICRCVSRAGGVAKDVLDRLLEETQAQLESGAFAQNLAADIRRLPREKQPLAIDALRRQSADERKDPLARQAILDALRVLDEE